MKTELARPMNQQRAIRIGVIADTHGLFDSTVGRHFKGVDHILHTGDIGDGSVIEQLEQIAPVTVVSGNVDNDEQSGFPSEAVIELAGLRIALRHILYAGEKLTKDGRAFLDREEPDICVFGHGQETLADLTGLQLLQRAKIDPAGMITFFERLSEKDQGRMEWLSTHPMSAARADRLKSELSALPKKSPEPFTFDWKQVQASLGTQPVATP